MLSARSYVLKLYLSESNTHTQTHAHTHTYTHTMLSYTCSLPETHICILIHMTPMYSFTDTHTHTLTHWYTQTQTYTTQLKICGGLGQVDSIVIELNFSTD